MHLLQVCNVGQIVGGTAACAWSITRALPQMGHTVAFLSSTDPVTQQAFEPHRIMHWRSCTSANIQRVNPDLVILHNVDHEGSTLWDGAFTIQYVHSAGRRLAADHTVYCSRWLAEKCRAPTSSVMWQGVPLPPTPELFRPQSTGRIRIGRICTPTARKWPVELIGFYTQVAAQHPHADWDFVGCPPALQSQLESACQGRASFLPASWQARSHVWNWDALLYHHPTLTESFGRTVAEAARAGCLPIVDDRGGFTEQLEVLGVRGCRTWHEFSQAIAAIPDRSHREQISPQRQQRASEHFSLRAFGERLRSLIVSLADSRGLQ